MATDDDDAATLRERVRELEATVAQQQDTIQQLMPSRRAILAGGAGLVGGAALTGQASAQSAAGQVGTSSEPVDVEAATVTASDVNTDSVNTADVGFKPTTGSTPITWQQQEFISSQKIGSGPSNAFSISIPSTAQYVVARGEILGPPDAGTDLKMRINGINNSSYFYEGIGVSSTSDATEHEFGRLGVNTRTGFFLQIFSLNSRPGYYTGCPGVGQGLSGTHGAFTTGGLAENIEVSTIDLFTPSGASDADLKDTTIFVGEI